MSRRAIVKRAKVDRGRRIISMELHPPISDYNRFLWFSFDTDPGNPIQFIGRSGNRHQFMRAHQRR